MQLYTFFTLKTAVTPGCIALKNCFAWISDNILTFEKIKLYALLTRYDKAMQRCDKNKFDLPQLIDFCVVKSENLITPNKQFFSVSASSIFITI
jgi:hypothetical protein